MKRAKIVKMKLHELAGVDAGAQDVQGTVILKRKEESSEPAAPPKEHITPVAVEKRSALTTSAAGHTHLLYGLDDTLAGTTSYESMYEEGQPRDHYTGHCHPWIRNEDGTITVGEAMGHSHEVGAMSASLKAAAKGNSTAAPVVSSVTTMSNVNADVDALKGEVASLKKQLADAQALANLTDAEKIHRATLPEHEREVFVAKSATERAEIVKSANEVVYTCADGTVVLKSQGPAMLAMAKRADDALKMAQAEKAARELTELTKRATDALGGLSCSVAAKVALFRAAEVIEDTAVRDEAVGALKTMAHAEKLAGSMSGVAGSPVQAEGDALAEFNAGVLKFAEKHAIKDQGAALEKFLDTPEGLALKRKYDASRAYGQQAAQ